MSETIACFECGKVVEKKTYHHKYCSAKCKAAEFIRGGRRLKFSTSCVRCGVQFRPENYTARFCSRDCAIKSLQEAVPLVSCSGCGKSFRKKKGKASKGTNHFCSRQCQGDFYRKAFQGTANPNFKNKGNRICIGCGALYKSYTCGRKFCSRNCSQKFCRSEGLLNARRGIEAERSCMKEMEKRGYHVSRSAASKGAFDVIAVNSDEVIFIQVKRTKSRMRLSPAKYVKEIKKIPVPSSNVIKRQIWTWLDRNGWIITEVS